jgi:hypothetical protein
MQQTPFSEAQHQAGFFLSQWKTVTFEMKHTE